MRSIDDWKLRKYVDICSLQQTKSSNREPPASDTSQSHLAFAYSQTSTLSVVEYLLANVAVMIRNDKPGQDYLGMQQSAKKAT
jgi:hypothetical protein